MASNQPSSKTSSNWSELKVIEISSSLVMNLNILQSDRCLVVFDRDLDSLYQLVFSSGRDKAFQAKFYCLCRSPNLKVVEQYYELSRRHFPRLFRIAVELCELPQLQEVWTLICANRGWTIAHLIAHYGLEEGLKDQELVYLFMILDRFTAMTPIHVAAKRKKAEFIKKISAYSAILKLDARDSTGNTAYHYAATSDPETIEALGLCGLEGINSKNADHQTPLQLACLEDKPQCVKALIVVGANICHNDEGSIVKTAVNSSFACAKEILTAFPDQLHDEDMKNGGTPLHWAKTKEILMAFIDFGCIIDARNFSGHTALHVMIQRDRFECVVALLSSGADPNLVDSNGDSPIHMAFHTAFPDQLHDEDMKNGGTPLHWATKNEIIMAFIEFGCRIDARNFSGHTALHVMIQRDRFECVVALLSSGADPNLVDSNGDSPIHMACSSASLLIIQALIVFGANVNLPNSQGESARHIIAVKRSTPQLLRCLHAVGAKRCFILTNCRDGCSPTGKDDGQSSGTHQLPRSRHVFDSVLHDLYQHSATAHKDSKSTNGGRILCLDGGGIRGLILIQMLEAIENVLEGPVIQYFDWVSGTSTGGILSLALCCGKSVQECKMMYFRLKDKVFSGWRPYSSEVIENFLRLEFGDRTMADISGPKLLITTVNAETNPPDLHFFRNYMSPQDMLSLPEEIESKQPEEQLVWQAARASAAAPTYFQAFGSYLDGALIANNPTLDVLTEIQEYNTVLKALDDDSRIQPMLVLSLGTGIQPSYQLSTVDMTWPTMRHPANPFEGGLNLISLVQNLVTSTDRRVVDRARSWCSMIECAYFRLSPSLEQDVPLNETRNDQLIPMLWETKAFLQSKFHDINTIADLLKF